ncbi:hypothetical protein CP533_1657 [Ophiocordyceps camponoti-saundersi (nom. inval.)]|nr:hypothetical protein CP533_1657 [Ophiocordyceps camponoti-saundersi (nom. inval.)]
MTSRESLRPQSRRRSSATAHSLAMEFAGHVPERGSSLKQWSISSSVTPTTMTELRSEKKGFSFPLADDDDSDSSSEDSFVQRRRRRRSQEEEKEVEEDNDEDGESLLFKQQGYGGTMGCHNLPGLGDTTIVSFSSPSSSSPSSSLPRRTNATSNTSNTNANTNSNSRLRNRTSARYRLRALGYIYDTDDDDDDDDDNGDNEDQDSSPPRFLPERRKDRRIDSRRVMRIEPVMEDYEEGHAADVEA